MSEIHFIKKCYKLKVDLSWTIVYSILQEVHTNFNWMHFFGFRFNEKWPIWLAPALIIGFLACFLHLLDRQSELTSRSDFLWQYKLSSEEEGVDTMRGINKILLENILPAHVAEHYLHRVQGISSTLQDSNVSLVVFNLYVYNFAFEDFFILLS